MTWFPKRRDISFSGFVSGNIKKKHIHPLPGKSWVYTTQKWDSQVSIKNHEMFKIFTEMPPLRQKVFWLTNKSLLLPPPVLGSSAETCLTPSLTSTCSVLMRSCVIARWLGFVVLRGSDTLSTFNWKQFSWMLCFFINSTNRHYWPLTRDFLAEVLILLL